MKTSLDLNTLFSLAETRAKENADGHLTIFRFTTGWKCCLGTPDLRSGDGDGQIGRLKCFQTLEEALIAFIYGDGFATTLKD